MSAAPDASPLGVGVGAGLAPPVGPVRAPGEPVLGTLVPLRLVALPLGLGLFAELLGWAVLAGVAPLGAGWYGWPSLLLGAHLVAIGGLLWPVVGAGWQLAPVVVAAPLPPRALRLAAVAGPVAVVGALLLWIGMGGYTAIGALGAALVILGLLARSVGLVPLLVGARGRVAVRAWLVGAEVCLWSGLGYAAALYAGKLGHPVMADPVTGIGHHVALLAVGWIGGWVLGLGALLLPMFALAREPGRAALLLAGVLWFGGIAAGNVPVWAGGALLAAGLLLRALAGARGVRGPGLVLAGSGLVGLVAIAGAAAFGILTGRALVLALFAGWLLPLQHGVALRIVPFLVWAHLLAGRSNTGPAALAFRPWEWAQVALWPLGAALLVGGTFVGEGVSRAGAAVLFVATGLHVAAVVGIGARAVRAWRSAVALPGTEAR